MGRMRGVFPEELFRHGGPDVVVSRSEINGIAPKGLENSLHLLPLRWRGGVERAFNCVAHRNRERGLFGCRRLPGLFVNTRSRFAGSVTEDHEAERRQIRRGPG